MGRRDGSGGAPGGSHSAFGQRQALSACQAILRSQHSQIPALNRSGPQVPAALTLTARRPFLSSARSLETCQDCRDSAPASALHDALQGALHGATIGRRLHASRSAMVIATRIKFNLAGQCELASLVSERQRLRNALLSPCAALAWACAQFQATIQLLQSTPQCRGATDRGRGNPSASSARCSSMGGLSRGSAR